MEAPAICNLTNGNEWEIYVENCVRPRFSVLFKWDVGGR